VTQDTGVLPEQRVPCATCGSTERSYPQYAKAHSAEQGVGYSIRFRTVARKGGKPVNWARMGTVYSYTLKKWVRREIQVDRSPGRNRYTEIVFDFETGEIIHSCDEPLNEHRGRGTAKGTKLGKP
jgi:hypothetical protein